MAVETERCPCMGFDLDVGGKREKQCFCGDLESQHDAMGCRAMHGINAPYDPELTAAALRLARRWLG